MPPWADLEECNENNRISAALSRLTEARSRCRCQQFVTSQCKCSQYSTVIGVVRANRARTNKALQLTRNQAASVGDGDNREAAHRNVELLSWVCSTCDRACIPIRSESRCLCGHRLKEHDKPTGKGACRSGLLHLWSGQTLVIDCSQMSTCYELHVET